MKKRFKSFTLLASCCLAGSSLYGITVDQDVPLVKDLPELFPASRSQAAAFWYSPATDNDVAWFTNFSVLVPGRLTPEQNKVLNQAGVTLIFYDWATGFYDNNSEDIYDNIAALVLNHHPDWALNSDPAPNHMVPDKMDAYYYDMAIPELRQARIDILAKTMQDTGFKGVFFDCTGFHSVWETGTYKFRSEFIRRHPGVDYNTEANKFYRDLKEQTNSIIFLNQSYHQAKDIYQVADYDLTESLMVTQHNGPIVNVYLEETGEQTSFRETNYTPVNDILDFCDELNEKRSAYNPNIIINHLNYCRPYLEPTGKFTGSELNPQIIYRQVKDRQAIHFTQAMALLLNQMQYTQCESSPVKTHAEWLYLFDLGSPEAPRRLCGNLLLRNFANGAVCVNPGPGNEILTRNELFPEGLDEGDRIFDTWNETFLPVDWESVSIPSGYYPLTNRHTPSGRTFLRIRNAGNDLSLLKKLLVAGKKHASWPEIDVPESGSISFELYEKIAELPAKNFWQKEVASLALRLTAAPVKTVLVNENQLDLSLFGKFTRSSAGNLSNNVLILENSVPPFVLLQAADNTLLALKLETREPFSALALTPSAFIGGKECTLHLQLENRSDESCTVEAELHLPEQFKITPIEPLIIAPHTGGKFTVEVTASDLPMGEYQGYWKLKLNGEEKQIPQSIVKIPISNAAFADTIAIDGKADDKVWQNRPEVALATGDHPEFACSFRTAYDRNFVYFFFHCQRPEQPYCEIAEKTDDSRILEDDGIEIYLDNSNMRTGGYRCMINTALQTLQDNVPGNTGMRPQSAICKHSDGSYDLEIAVPLQALAVMGQPAAGTQWAMHVIRKDHLDGKPFSLGWSFKATPGGWGSLRFSPALSRDAWKIVASHGKNQIAGLTDGDQGSRWTSGAIQAPGMFVQLDLGKEESFRAVRLYITPNRDDAAIETALELSADGKNYTRAGMFVNDPDNPHQQLCILPEKISARYLRITLVKAKQAWWSIHELDLLDY